MKVSEFAKLKMGQFISLHSGVYDVCTGGMNDGTYCIPESFQPRLADRRMKKLWLPYPFVRHIRRHILLLKGGSMEQTKTKQKNDAKQQTPNTQTHLHQAFTLPY